MKNVRTRFAPSPTGIMHIGNIRAALLNYLFAQKQHGTFVLRIEDTDQKRNFDPGAVHIQEHLSWLGLTPEEGPKSGGPYAPYFQSQRHDVYQKNLQLLIDANITYRCFCTPEELDAKRQRQIALKRPPRYDGTCTKLSPETIQKNLEIEKPFVWRVKIDSTQQLSFTDLARGPLTFDLKNFSDFPITREDGSFTFVFANCVDDFEMKMSHVFRGEDHLTNTVSQVVLLKSFHKPIPIFWHLPIMCNLDGKKLSKRDRGFSLEDLINAGFLPEAICNYLGIIGGSFEQEILTLPELVQAYNFENLHSTSQMRYDLDKLTWINHKWIAQYDIVKLTNLCKPYLQKSYDLSNVSDASLQILIQAIKTDINTLLDITTLLKFYFEKPHVTKEELVAIIPEEKIESLKKILQQPHESWSNFSAHISAQAKLENISSKELYSSIRFLLTGSPTGLQIKDLFESLGSTEFFKRLQI